MELSTKYIDFIKHQSSGDILEGTTSAGKTTIGITKFMLKVAQSHKKFHAIAALDLGTIERNILNKDLGLLEQFEGYASYKPNGHGKINLPHVLYHVTKPTGEIEDNIIYLFGYSDKTKWKKALGGQYGCVMIDEVNVSDQEFVNEIMMRQDYFMLTLNPDDPKLPVYENYINKGRPLAKHKKDIPQPIMDDLLKSEAKEGWIYWFFTFYDNKGLTDTKIEQIMSSVPKGTKAYKNKIEGLRGRHSGLVLRPKPENFISKAWLNVAIENGDIDFEMFTVGVDTSYSRKTDDKISFAYQGITKDGKLIKLGFETYNNRDIGESTPDAYIGPSDIGPLLHEFVKKYRTKYGGNVYCIYIDSADSATNIEVNKYMYKSGANIDVVPSWKVMSIVDRIEFENSLYQSDHCLIVEEDCKEHINELNVYSWKDKKQEPEDANDHTINSSQYGFAPFVQLLGPYRADN